MHNLIRTLVFLDKHSGMISSVGLVLAGIGVLLTLRHLKLYGREIRKNEQEQQRLAWERIFKLLQQVVIHSAEAHLASVAHSPITRQAGFLPPQVAAKYGPAMEQLVYHWHQLRVELSMMPNSPLIEEVAKFMYKYDGHADAWASDEFQKEIAPIAIKLGQQAQKSFGGLGPEMADGPQSSLHKPYGSL